MKKQNHSFFWLVLFSLIGGHITGQPPLNTNKLFGTDYQCTTMPSGSEDWHFDVVALPGGDYITGGYTDTSSFGGTHPVVVKYDLNGSILWEHVFECMYGLVTRVYDMPNGYLVIGEGNRITTGLYVCLPEPQGFFSALLDKTTGNLDLTYGIKYYNQSTLIFPQGQNGLGQTIISSHNNNRARSCEIKNASGQITGFMICGSYVDNRFPSNTTSLTDVTNGSFLLKLDANGYPDQTFGTGGVRTYFQNGPTTFYEPHLYNVCVNYDASGNPQGYVVVGAINETPNTLTQYVSFAGDAMFFMTDLSGNITKLDIFDENQHNKNATAVSYPYTDTPDNIICPSSLSTPFLLPQENNNEKAVRVKQISNGGGFVIVSMFDMTNVYYSSSCPQVYSLNGFFVLSDPAVIKIDGLGNILWSTNIMQSTGRDFDNDLEVSGNDILVCGVTNTEPVLGGPTEQYGLISKLNASSGAIVYENAYSETNAGQTMFCTFAIDLNGPDIIIAGDNDVNGDNFQLIKCGPY